jgi:hypothetical protein
MSKELDELKKLLKEHKTSIRKAEMGTKITAFNEKQNNIKNCSERTVYQLDLHEKFLMEFVSKFTPVPQQWKLKILREQENQTSEALTFIVKYIKIFLETYRHIATDLDTDTIKSNKVLLNSTKHKRADPYTMIWRLIQQMPVIIRKKMSDKTTMVFKDCEKLVKDYIDCKEKNKEDVSLKGKTKSFFEKEHLKDVGLGTAGFIAEKMGSFAGHFFKSTSIGNVVERAGSALIGAAATKIYSERRKHHDIKATFDKLNSEVEKAKLTKDIKSKFNKFGGGGSYKALRSSTVMVGDNPGGRESISIGNQAFKTNGPSLLRIKAGQSIHANPLSGMGKTRINPKDFDALGGGTTEPITATANTDRITDALYKNTEVLELIYKEQHDKFKEDRKISRKKTLGEHATGFLNAKDKKGYIQNAISESSLGDKSIGEHIGGFIDSPNKKGYIGNVIKNKVLGNIFGKGKGIAGGLGEVGTLVRGAEGLGGLGEVAGGAATGAGGLLAGAGGLLAAPELATGAAITAALALGGFGAYKMATGHNAGVAPESMLPSSLKGTGGAATHTPEQLANAIKKTESGGNYGAVGASGEIGAYQYMPGTWGQYSSEYAKGTGVTRKVEMTPANQDAVTQYKIKQWKAQGLSEEDIAAKWNAGENKNWRTNIGVNKKGVPYNTPAYVNKVMGNIETISPTANNPVPITPAKIAEKQLEVVKAQSDLHTKAKTEEQLKKDALTKAASKVGTRPADTSKSVTRDATNKGNTMLSSGDASLVNMFNAQWGRS